MHGGLQRTWNECIWSVAGEDLPKVLRLSLRLVVVAGDPAVAGLSGVCLVCRPALFVGARMGLSDERASGVGVSGGESSLPG